VDNNSGKTYGFSFSGTPVKPWTYTINFLAGPELTTGTIGNTSATSGIPAGVNGIWRQTWDAILMYTPNTQWSFMANYDYGRGDRTVTNSATNPFTLSPPVYWTGGAAYAKYSPTANDYLAARYEYFYDNDGFTTTSSIPSGFIAPGFLNASFNVKKPHYQEITATYQHTLESYLLTRFEYRHDWSEFPVYAVSSFAHGKKFQDTISLSLILLFDSRNAK